MDLVDGLAALANDLWGNVGATRKAIFIHTSRFFQWVNPKIWAIALTASSGYSVGLPPIQEAFRLASTFSSMNLFVCLFWTSTGTLLAYLLTRPVAWRMFIRAMALALAATAVMVFI